MTRLQGAGLAVVLVVAAGVAMIGCGDDLYGECSIDADSHEQCVDDGDGERVSCIVDQHLECETGTCGRYNSSDPFCTMECSEDGDCPSGECRSFLLTSEQKYCVSTSDLESTEQ